MPRLKALPALPKRRGPGRPKSSVNKTKKPVARKAIAKRMPTMQKKNATKHRKTQERILWETSDRHIVQDMDREGLRVDFLEDGKLLASERLNDVEVKQVSFLLEMTKNFDKQINTYVEECQKRIVSRARQS